MLRVEQTFERHRVTDIPSTIAEQMDAAGFAAAVRPGARIAIGVGSRGIANIDRIAGAAVRYWKMRGAHPFIFPAMGSHGAGTAEGQANVLARYGISERTMGCPILSSLDVVPLTKTADGIQTYIDRNAYESDGVMLLSRVKWHTAFEGSIESGLFKMMAIGMGKLTGARRYHASAYTLGLERVVKTVGREVLKCGKILGGIAILEDAYHNTGQLTAVRADVMEREEEKLLATVKRWKGRLPMNLDILIVDEIGKNISGPGMDSKVVNRGPTGTYNPWPNEPTVQRIFVRALSEETYGNACGAGLADIVHDRLVAAIDPEPTYVNIMTSGMLAAGRVPMHYGSDRKCIEILMGAVGKIDLEEVRVGWIRNTLEIHNIALSENLRDEIGRNASLRIVGSAFDLPFDERGDLQPVFELERMAAT